jgi:ribosomal 50S subunit-associated protein YjgA (DUF615 family)
MRLGEQVIRNAQIELETNERKQNTELEKAGLQLEREQVELMKLQQDALKCLAQDNPQLDSKLEEVSRKRNKAKEQFMHLPMRKQEETAIEKLERDLAHKTQQLATVGKELIQYRHRLIHQEDEYNYRFGAEPTVGILAPLVKTVKKRPTTMFSHRLPRMNSTLG